MNDPTDDELEALLAEPEPYIPDEGFTASVIARLPPPRRRDRRVWLQVAATAVAAVLFGLLGGGTALLALVAPLAAPLAAGAAPIVLALLVAAGAAWYPLTLALEDE